MRRVEYLQDEVRHLAAERDAAWRVIEAWESRASPIEIMHLRLAAQTLKDRERYAKRGRHVHHHTYAAPFRAMAVQLAARVGVVTAAKALSVPVPTVSCWAKQAGLDRSPLKHQRDHLAGRAATARLTALEDALIEKADKYQGAAFRRAPKPSQSLPAQQIEPSGPEPESK